MLKGLDNRLNAEVLFVLRAMGHGDTIVLTDTNFPADAVARQTVHGRLLRMENLDAGQVAEAVLSVLPLEASEADFAMFMEVIDRPDEPAAVHAEVQTAIDRAEGRHRPMIPLERFAFYDLARQAYAVILTGERRFFGNFILRKGVLAPDP